ncbi:aspartyl protease family protein [Flavobacterium sp. 14A]|uniref:aspartyl protease family protein n=1 Tax=Flavobacterium sp. 14A TaxID=2735896 RepID=UPI0015713D83|nr:aspartyl protease family protein [Flavobacterium sp. 14A]NRT11435.1 putative aspartyl protease [Flavobacterium sp. 14A]
MKHILLAFFLFVIIGQNVYSQVKLPILKSNIKELDIKEGTSLYKKTWNVSPKIKPDVFVTNAFKGSKQIVFYSDIDSIKFTVKPNKKYDFIVLLDGKEKAYSQINTYSNEEPSLDPKLFYTRLNANAGAIDTIPFKLGEDNRIHFEGRINQSTILNFLFDTGASSCIITSSIINKKVLLNIDSNRENVGTDGVSTVGVSRKNTVEINNLIWSDVTLLSIDYKKPSFDAVIGWVAFENKIVEIDYENNILAIHQSLPELSNEYTKIDLKLIGGIPYIKCQLIVNGKETEGWFDFDTGSDGELSIGQFFAKEHSLINVMKETGTSESIGTAGNRIKSKEVILPILKLGKYEMYKIPLSIELEEVEGVGDNENIGNSILKRFNTIMDFRNNYIYLKPNSLFHSPF